MQFTRMNVGRGWGDVGLEMLGSSAALDRIFKKLQWVKGRRRQLLRLPYFNSRLPHVLPYAAVVC